MSWATVAGAGKLAQVGDKAHRWGDSKVSGSQVLEN